MTDEQRQQQTAERIRRRWSVGGKERSVTIDRLDDYRGGGLPMYGGSTLTNHTLDFMGDVRSCDAWLRSDLRVIRARSRQLERGNEWCQSFKVSLINNVLGCRGIHWKMNVRTSKAFGDKDEGTPDLMANSVITKARTKFELPENFSTRKDASRKDVDKFLLQRLAFDGEFIARKVYAWDNDFAFTWKFIEPDYLDENCNRIDGDGHPITMGVKRHREHGFVISYFFLRRRPMEWVYNQPVQSPEQRWEEVKAADVLHVFIRQYPEQTRGIPWPFASLVNLQNIGEAAQSATIAMRLGANQLGFFTQDDPDGISGNKPIITFNSEPGQFTQLPPGVKPSDWKPQYPADEYEPFNKAMLRGVAASLGQSYAGLTGDMSESNYSSSRMGLSEEQEQWKQIQEFLIEKWKQPEFDEWLYRSMLAGEVRLPIAKFDKFNDPKFTGRRWGYVNPQQDMAAIQLKLQMGLTSISRELDQTGVDRDELLEEITRDKADFGALGVDPFSGGNQAPAEEGDGESDVGEMDAVKTEADAYGVAVRAGAITPCHDDETHFRGKMGLPALNAAISSAWTEDGGVRRPITLTGKDGVKAALGTAGAPPKEGAED